MNLNKTDITVILDRSGSMSDCRKETVAAFNEFIQGQKEGVGECVVSLVQFDNKYEPNYTAKSVHDVRPLNEETYVPRGGTALLEAIGRTINIVGDRLRDTPEAQRPGTVLIVIQTDGYENSSEREWTSKRIQDMIAHQRDKYQWNFLFLGAGIDAIASASQIGLSSHHANSYGKTHSVGTFRATSNSFNALRSAKAGGMADATYSVTTEERLAGEGK